MRRFPWLVVLALPFLPTSTHAAPLCGRSSLLLAVGTEVRDPVRLGEQFIYRTTVVCRNGLTTQTTAVRDTRAYAPFYSSLRDPTAPVAALVEALAKGRIGVLGSCTLPVLTDRNWDLVKVAWFGAGGRENHLLFFRGESNLFPACSTGARELFEAIRGFESAAAGRASAQVVAF